MKKVAGGLRLDLSQYRELAAFAQFGSDLDRATQARLARGERIVEILKQDERSPMPVEEQVAVIYAATHGYLDTIPVEKVREFEKGLLNYLRTERSDVLTAIRETRDLAEETEAALKDAISQFKTRFEA